VKPSREEGLSEFLDGRLSWTELADRQAISGISILLTYQCPAACDHCVFRSAPGRTETVDLETARAFIEAASRQQPPPSVAFSGGEPFLRLEMMKDLAGEARRRGMAWEVISSSSWCRSAAQAREGLRDLRRLGLETYCTSIDRFHLRYVPFRRMRFAVSAALELGIRVVINTMADPALGGREREFLAETLDLPLETVTGLRVNVMKTVPAGRAVERVSDYLYRVKDLREGCPFSTDVVTLSPEGLLYPCCGMVIGEEPRAAGLFVQDNLNGKNADDVAAVLKALKSDLFFKVLQVLGPYRVLEILKARRPELVTRDRYVGGCDVCLEFVRNPGVVRATEAFLAEAGRRLAAP
jgi:hypothetical protein